MVWIDDVSETVSLKVKTETGLDDFGSPIYTDGWEEISGVLVGNVSSEDAVEALNLHGKYIAYTLCIPKGDSHIWENTEVLIRGKKFRTVGMVKEYKEGALPPLPWNRSIGVEHYE